MGCGCASTLKQLDPQKFQVDLPWEKISIDNIEQSSSRNPEKEQSIFAKLPNDKKYQKQLFEYYNQFVKSINLKKFNHKVDPSYIQTAHSKNSKILESIPFDTFYKEYLTYSDKLQEFDTIKVYSNPVAFEFDKNNIQKIQSKIQSEELDILINRYGQFDDEHLKMTSQYFTCTLFDYYAQKFEQKLYLEKGQCNDCIIITTSLFHIIELLHQHEAYYSNINWTTIQLQKLRDQELYQVALGDSQYITLNHKEILVIQPEYFFNETNRCSTTFNEQFTFENAGQRFRSELFSLSIIGIEILLLSQECKKAVEKQQQLNKITISELLQGEVKKIVKDMKTQEEFRNNQFKELGSVFDSDLVSLLQQLFTDEQNEFTQIKERVSKLSEKIPVQQRQIEKSNIISNLINKNLEQICQQYTELKDKICYIEIFDQNFILFQKYKDYMIQTIENSNSQKKLQVQFNNLAKSKKNFFLNFVAQMYLDYKKFDAAILFYKRLAQISIIDNNQDILIQSLQKLIEIYKQTTQYEEAISILKSILVIDQLKYGQVSQLVSTDMNKLAFFYEQQSKHNDAIIYYKKALEIDEKIYGHVHSDVATDLNNLASVYNELGQLETACQLYRKTLTIDEKILGTEHPDYEIDVCNLANILNKLHKQTEAVALYQQLIQIVEKKYGQQSPKYLLYVGKLAQIQLSQNQYDDQIANLKRILDTAEATQNTQDIANNMQIVGKALLSSGKLEESLQYFKKALEVSENKYGISSQEILGNLNSIAQINEQLGNFDEALSYYQRVLQIDQQKGGEISSDAAIDMCNIADIYRKQKKYEESIKLFQKALEIDQQLLGDEDQEIITDLCNLASVNQTMGKVEDALIYMKKAYNLSVKLLGNENEKSKCIKSNLDLLEQKQTTMINQQ